MRRNIAYFVLALFSVPAPCLATPVSDFLFSGISFQATGGVADLPALLDGQEEAGEQEIKLSLGGGLQFGGVFAQRNNYDTVAGLGLFGIAMAQKSLAPDKPFPFPAVGTAEVDLFYAPGRDGVSDYLFTARVGFGINLLHMKPGMLFYPYAAVGLGFETLTGTIKAGATTKSVADTHFILPAEIGIGFAMEIQPGMSVFARINFTFPVNAANIAGLLRAQGGILVSF